jgi:hypothetical protein
MRMKRVLQDEGREKGKTTKTTTSAIARGIGGWRGYVRGQRGRCYDEESGTMSLEVVFFVSKAILAAAWFPLCFFDEEECTGRARTHFSAFSDGFHPGWQLKTTHFPSEQPTPLLPRIFEQSTPSPTDEQPPHESRAEEVSTHSSVEERRMEKERVKGGQR